jgi:YHS domain-containing protein
MAILFRILFFIFGIYLVRRFFGAIMGSNRKPETDRPADATTQMVKDPVCGMYMDSRLAVRLENRSEILFFCSEGCKTKFLDSSSGAGK